METCNNCLRSIATEQDWKNYPEGEGSNLCWGSNCDDIDPVEARDKEIEKLRAENAELKDALEQKDIGVDRLRVEHAELITENEKFRAENTELQKAKDSTEASLNFLASNLSGGREAVGDMVCQLRAENAELKAQIARENLPILASDYEQTIEQLRAENQALKGELELIQNKFRICPVDRTLCEIPGAYSECSRCKFNSLAEDPKIYDEIIFFPTEATRKLCAECPYMMNDKTLCPCEAYNSLVRIKEF